MLSQFDHEKGAAAIMVAIALVVLMGFAALAIDGGLGFDDRRGTQNAADNAALAAAWEACNPRTSPADPEGSALAVAAQNGYDDTDPATTVTVSEVDTDTYEVVIDTENDTTFAAPGVGADTLSVESRAVATCEQELFLGGYAIFAGAESCSSGGSVELDLAGSTKTINGGVFSNGDLKITGSDTTINGSVEYRAGFNSNSGVTAEKYFGSAKDYPLDLSIDDFRSGGSYRSDPNFVDAAGLSIDNNWMRTQGYATGSNSSITITKSGIYYTSNSGNKAVDLKQVSAAPGVKVTFVAEGEIKMTGSSDIGGYAPIQSGGYTPVLFFSNAGSPPACNTNAIQFSGSDISWTGLMFAPRGEVQMSSSSNVSFDGSIIAHTVSVSGSNFALTWQDDPGGEPRFTVELTE